MKRMRAMALPLAAAALVAAGCGGATQSVFVSKANAICSSDSSVIKNLDPTDPSSTKTVERIFGSFLSKLEALSPPSDRAAAFSSFLSAVKEEDVLLDQAESAIVKHDYDKARSLVSEMSSEVQAADRASKAAGIECT